MQSDPEKKIHVKIITPQGVVATLDAFLVQVPAVTGYLAVEWNHRPIVTPLRIGQITMRTDLGTRKFAASGGYMEFNNNKMTILAETVEEAGKIDIDRAARARDQARKELAAAKTAAERKLAQEALEKAKIRLKLVDQY